jgi:hypothetical protein
MFATVVTIDTENLSNPPAVLVEPGRIADHIDRGTFRLDKVQTMVLTNLINHCNWVSMSKCHLSLGNCPNLTNASSMVSHLRYGDKNTPVVNPTILDFIPKLTYL